MRTLTLVLLILAQASSAQRLEPIIGLPPCDHVQIGLAARALIGPDPVPSPTPELPEEICFGRVCESKINARWARKYADRAELEYQRWQNLDLQARACGY